MKYCAGYRGVLETITILALTVVMSDADFATFIAGFYPIYFVAMIVFSAATVDLAGGKRAFNIAIPVGCAMTVVGLLFGFMQSTVASGAFYIIAAASSIESLAFVYCEATNRRLALIGMLLVKLVVALGLSVSVLLSANFTLDIALYSFIARDLCAIACACVAIGMFHEDIAKCTPSARPALPEMLYLVVSNAQEFALRIILNGAIGGRFIKDLEYALRLPRIIQIGLLLGLRHTIFAESPAFVDVRLLRVAHCVIGGLSLVCVCIANFDEVRPPMLVATSALLSACAVPWYINGLRERKFLSLVSAQLFAFFVTIGVAIFSDDPYLSAMSAAFALFVFSAKWVIGYTCESNLR